jgi:hypothetical protein
MLAVVLSLLPALAAGWFAAGGAPRSPAGLLLRCGLAVGLALGFTSVTYFLRLVWDVQSTPAFALAELPFFALLSVALWLLQRRLPPALPAPSASLAWPRWLTAALLLALGCALGTGALQAWRSPHGDIDTLAIWNLRARFFHRGGEAWREAFSPYLWWSHTDYPLLLPANVARCWTYAGSETTAAPQLLALLFAAGTVALLVAGTALLRTPAQGCLAGIVLAATPFYVQITTAQYADVPLGFYFLASVLLFEVYDRADVKPSRLPLLAGLLTGMAAWTKNEGQLFLVATLLARGVAALRGGAPWRVRGAEWLAFAAGLAPLLACLAYFKLRVALPNDLVKGQSLAATWERVTTLRRYGVIAAGTLAAAGRLLGAGGALPLYGFLLGRAPKPRREGWHAALVLAVMLAGYALVYLTTPHDVAWHVDFSADRLLLQLWPTGLLLFFLRVAAPEEKWRAEAA